MKARSRMFVSYTLRDGRVTKPVLENLYSNLQEICLPFVHAIDADSKKYSQLGVIQKLLRSHVILVVESPEVYKSPWVKIEIFIARLRLIPILRLNVTEITELPSEALNRINYVL